MKLIIDIDNYQYEHFLRHYKDEPSPRLIDEIIAKGIPLEDIVDGIESHKWGKNEGSKEIYNNAIDDVLTYIEEKLGEQK